MAGRNPVNGTASAKRLAVTARPLLTRGAACPRDERAGAADPRRTHLCRVTPGALHIGCSGYVYQHWKRIFYPDDVPAARWLEYYARIFKTTELNNTFYRLPTPHAVDGWRQRSPKEFIFAVKGSRFMTHMKRLLEPEESLEMFFRVVNRLRPKIGSVLWQLHPQMKKQDLPRLEHFLSVLPKKYPHAIEFRSDAWYTDETCELLDRYGAAFVEHDLVDRPPPAHTGGWRYLRFHGATGKYRGRYGKRALRKFADDLLDWKERGKTSFVYFNNDIHGHALVDALDLLELTGTPSYRPEHLVPGPD